MKKNLSTLTAFLYFATFFQPLLSEAAVPLAQTPQPLVQEVPVTLQNEITPEKTSVQTNAQSFMQANALSTAAAPAPQTVSDSRVLGVQKGQTVSGVIEVRPNTQQLPGIKKVAYYLNGNKSGKVYSAPFIWGGVAGDGTKGLDSKSIANGNYKLDMIYTDSAGDHVATVNFIVNNNSFNADSGSVPTTTWITPSGHTIGGLQFPAATSFVSVKQSGNFSFLANSNALYIVDSSNASQPKVLSSVDFISNPPILDIAVTPDAKAVFVLEQGPVDSNTGFHNGRLWRVDISNPAKPVRQLVENGSSSFTGRAKGLVVQSNTVYVLINEEYALLSCPVNGGPCQIPSELYSLRDQMVINNSGKFSVQRGGTILRSAPGAMAAEDFADTTTPAPIAYLSGKDNFLFVSLQNGTTVVYDTNQKNPNTGILPVVKTIDPQGNNSVFSIAEGNRLAVLDASGLIEVFDITNIQNVTKIDSFTVAGARSVAIKNGNIYAVTGDQYRILTPVSSSSTPPDARILGVQDGAKVSGVIQVRPNAQQLPGIKKVAYYLNGIKSGKVYESPFIWGGPSGTGTTGVDTRTLASGNYTLSIAYTDATGDHVLETHFIVAN